MSKTERLYFHAAIKSVPLLDPILGYEDTGTYSDVSTKVQPKGTNYFIRRDVILEPDDWVIFGVASTSDVDLVDDMIDAEEVFSESLEEFVNTGRIFWEHGYKLAGKVDADNPITAPIGIPYLVEIFNNELMVYIILDKSHPTSRMVWERINGSDNRFSRAIGLSIGALPQGNPKMIKDPMTGNYVKKSPKMRLYEISVTGQPINPHTWTQVVKSFINENLKEEEMPVKRVAKTKAMDTMPPEMMDDSMTLAMDDEQDMETKAMEEGQEDMDMMPAEDDSADVDIDIEATDETEEPAVAAMGDMPLDGEGAGDMGMQMPGGQDGESGMLDMLGGMDEQSGLEGSEDTQEEEIATDVLLDKIDMLTTQVSEILEKLNMESDASDVAGAMEDSMSPDVEQTPPPYGEESDAGEPDATAGFDTEDMEEEEEEDDRLDAIAKSFADQADRTDLIFEVVKQIPQILKSVHTLSDRLEMIEYKLSALPNERSVPAVKSAPAKSTIAQERAKFEATTKSMTNSDRNTVKKGLNSKGHPGLEDSTINNAKKLSSEQNDSEVVLKSIVANDNKLTLLAELVTTFKSLNGNPVYVAEKKEEIYDIANETLGLDRSTFRRAISLVKNVTI